MRNRPVDDLTEASSGDVGGVSSSPSPRLLVAKLSLTDLDAVGLGGVSTMDGCQLFCCCCCGSTRELAAAATAVVLVDGASETALGVAASWLGTTPWLNVFLCFLGRCRKGRWLRLMARSAWTSSWARQALGDRSASG